MNKRTNQDSELMTEIKELIEVSPDTNWNIAYRAGMTIGQLEDFIYHSRGTQIRRAEKILNALGFEIQLIRRNKNV